MGEGTAERAWKMAAAPTSTAGKMDPGELGKLFVEHHARVYQAAYRITGNAGDAEDVLQTVFLRLVRQDRAALTVGNMQAYLHRAAVNTALDVVRLRRDSKLVPVEKLAPVLAGDRREEPERKEQSRELRDLVRRAVARLSPRAAEIFALRYFEGYDNKEIAAMLDISQTDVAVSLHRSRARLQEEIRTYQETGHER
ncbi:MAG: RNA polymerase sigma factor [bacterium]|jgi:RNA polymerase sigma-70 factor (ECF subfamily)